MSDVVTTPEVETPAVDTSPAAAPAVEATAAALAVTEVVGAPPADTGPKDTAPEPPPVVDEAPPPYDWDSWDPASLDGVPDTHRPALERLEAHWREKYDKVSFDQDVFNAYLSGEDDPRIAEVTGERDEWQSKHASVESELSQARQDLTSFKAQVKAEQTAAIERHARWMMHHYKDVFSDDARWETYKELFGLGMEAELAAELSRAEPDARDMAVEAVKNGASGPYVLKLMSRLQAAGSRPATPEPRPAAAIVGGADGTTSKPAPKPRKVAPEASLDPFSAERSAAIRNVLKIKRN